MAPKNAATVAKKWASRSAAALPEYKEGVANVSVSPTAEAAKNLDKAKLGFNDAVDSGRMGRALLKVSREDWIRLTLEKGAARFSGGVTAAQPKMETFMADFLPFQAAVTDAVRKMPSMDFEQNIARMTAQARGTHEYKSRR